ncbi:MAG: helix-turn-helix domain-containing protein [Alphaproteobacteria bacterium]|nr:helix-turn-helix domain-containing protein [Alphaproteobacteria bacterium]
MSELHPVFTPEKRAQFLEELINYPNITAACEKIGVSRRTVYNERNANAGFKKAWEEAMKLGIGALEDEAHRRAFKGVLKITKHGTYLEYSDTLAIFLLKAHDPERYKDRSHSEVEGKGNYTLNVVTGVPAITEQNPEVEDDFSDLV